MTDHIDRVREQAERASREAYGFNGVRGHDSRNGTRRKAFIAGAVWAASRVTPTREEIAVELRKHKLVHVSVSRKSAFCTCNSSVVAGTDANLEWFESHRANAVLALMAEVAEGETDGSN